jgi:parallel beta-helix repeat protein
MRHGFATLTLACILATASAGQATQPRPILKIDRDTVLDPAKEYGAIVITTPNVTIDGRGASLVGDSKADPARRTGIAIQADGVNNVILKNIHASGWETGLSLKNAEDWKVEDCDFSDNFHDPAFGWGENGRRGGIVLESVRKSAIRRCKANNVWDACVLVDCDDNELLDNDFSHTSNTCLKLWHSSRNTVERNNLSYGIRKDPGEVHARDSTSVLIETGSNENRFMKNDCTHGGDGIFIRVLNGWVSTGNIFEANDCSYANNNCVEAWSPRNTWVKNIANHGSYGFWLGASDQNVLIDNQASFNGLPDGNHNSPHLPNDCHAGIVFMFGPSSHTVLRGNRCEGNNGAGIAAIGDEGSQGKAWNAFHWVADKNTLKDNRWGVYLADAEMFDLGQNMFENNREGDVFDAGRLVDVRTHKGDAKESPVAQLDGPSVVTVGEDVTFDARGSSDLAGHPLHYRWRTQPEADFEGAVWKRSFPKPGFYRLALTVNNGSLSDLAWRDVYAVRPIEELGTEGAASDWDWIDDHSTVTFSNDPDQHISGQQSLKAKIAPYSGGRTWLRRKSLGGISLSGKSRLVFWLRTRNSNIPGWQDGNPLVRLISTGAGGRSEAQPPALAVRELVPSKDLLQSPPAIEAREGWSYFEIPLKGDNTWKATGGEIKSIDAIALGFDSWSNDPLTIWIDGLGLE